MPMPAAGEPEGAAGAAARRRSAYQARAASHAAARDALGRVSAAVARWRLATFLSGAAALVWGFRTGEEPWFATSTVLFAAFAALVVRHARVDERAAWRDALRVVNERSAARIARDWDTLPAGEASAGVDVDAHPYARDLDLFGRASVYQWLGPAATAAGASSLARALLAPPPAAALRERQAAVKELAQKEEWREQLSAFGAVSRPPDHAGIGRFLEWAEGTSPPLPFFTAFRIGVPLLAAGILVLIALHAFGLAPALWAPLLVGGILLSFGTARRVQHAFDAAGAGQERLKQHAGLFAHLVASRFATPLLAELQQQLRGADADAPAAMRRLDRILGFADLRRGAALLHFPIQALTLWDFHFLFALERWRRATGHRLRGWFDAAGEIDALSSLAGAAADNPEWCWPQLAEDATLRARAIAHPLLPDGRRVANDVTVGPPGTVLLVTGSNMSGKSTLLRAIGVNAVLAQAGAPVCAAEMRLPPCDVYTSIRIQDSLERGVSYFMAALARLKTIVDAARPAEAGLYDGNAARPAEAGLYGGQGGIGESHERRVLLYLLDEILQGTNSVERGLAVQAVVRHLLAAPAIGAITTHDLALAQEEPLRSAAVPVHFTETVEADGGMRFDYRLREGLATSRNALRLMQLIGIRPLPES